MGCKKGLPGFGVHLGFAKISRATNIVVLGAVNTGRPSIAGPYLATIFAQYRGIRPIISAKFAKLHPGVLRKAANSWK